jgi:fructosamine-3-kinase
MKNESVVDSLGLDVLAVSPVAGGDINKAFRLSTTTGEFFLKVNDALRYPKMFEQEARGLAALTGDNVRVPRVMRFGEVRGQQFLLLEWIERGAGAMDAWEKFGTGLAEIHKKPQKHFGLSSDNFIGSLSQSNRPSLSWPQFYSDQRILPLVKNLRDHGSFDNSDVASAEALCKRLAEIYPLEHPSLVHGDLWSGNFMFDDDGSACIFDPAVYCGHREMDLAMTKLFGGFDEKFYDGYRVNYPLDSGWERRLRISQLYPILVHAILFGGRYVKQAASIINKF